MANIRLSKTVFKKEDLDKAVNKEFTSLISPIEQDTDTIEEFFRLYNKFFYQIPAEGETDSHEFLIRESSKLVKLESEDLEVQPLLDEIADLRERVLQQNINNLDSQNEIFKTVLDNAEGATKETEKLLDKLRNDVDNAANLRIEGQASTSLAQNRLGPSRKIPSTRWQDDPAKKLKVSLEGGLSVKKRTNKEVRDETDRLLRNGFSKQEVRENLKRFGANKNQITRFGPR